ncbi:MAG: DUF2442 domain-containing protein [Ginsengibacter sp.]
MEAIEKYKLNIWFNDGTHGVYDVADLAGKGVFKIWDIDDHFFGVGISKESGAISWPGEIDIDTINAYCSIKGISPDKFIKNQVTHATN